MAHNNRFSFIGGLIDPNLVTIRNNYVYFKHTNPKHLAKKVEEGSIKVKQITAAEQTKEIAESREEIKSGKRQLPDTEVYEEAVEPVKKKRKQTKKQVRVYSPPDALD